MIFTDAQRDLDRLRSDGTWPFNGITCEYGPPYDVAGNWFGPDDVSSIPLAGCNGVYVYTSPGGEIWYVGKGEHKAGGGIGKRCCSAHLGKAERDQELRFPNHDWAAEPIDAQINDSLKRGRFLIHTINVEPDACCSLVEVTLQTMCLLKDDRLPPLNNKIG